MLLNQPYNPTRQQLAEMIAAAETETNNFARLTQWRRRWKRATGEYPSSKFYRVIYTENGPLWAPLYY